MRALVEASSEVSSWVRRWICVVLKVVGERGLSVDDELGGGGGGLGL